MGEMILPTTENPEYRKCLINVMMGMMNVRVCRRMAVPTIHAWIVGQERTCSGNWMIGSGSQPFGKWDDGGFKA